jgi:hypothetical protein
MNICGRLAAKWYRIIVTIIKGGAIGLLGGRLSCWGLVSLFYWLPEPSGG